MLFYIPRFKSDDLRGALGQAESFARRDLKDLHGFGDVPFLREHVWLQYEFFHPSNTKLLTNPTYRTRGRALGSDSTGKFTQYRLEKKEEPDDMTEEDKRQTWNDRVRYIARLRRNGWGREWVWGGNARMRTWEE